MPSIEEQRLAKHFTSLYNSTEPKDRIVDLFCNAQQDAPDAICTLLSGRKIGLELTTVWPPKGTRARKNPHKNLNFRPLVDILDRKLICDYRANGVSGVWLFVHMRATIPVNLITDAIREIVIPRRFEKVFLEGPIPGETIGTQLNVLELPEFKIWSPNIPRPNRFQYMRSNKLV